MITSPKQEREYVVKTLRALADEIEHETATPLQSSIELGHAEYPDGEVMGSMLDGKLKLIVEARFTDMVGIIRVTNEPIIQL